MKRMILLSVFVVAAAAPATIAWKIFTNVRQAALFSKVQSSKPPLTVDQVIALLGQPTRIDQSETTGITGQVYHYVWNGRDHTVVFVNNTVFEG